MATFPTNPSVNDTVTMGDVTYKWNGNGWQVDVGSGGGGSSEWTDNSGVLHPNTHATDTVAIGTDTGDSNAELTIDGSGSFKSQSSAPTDTTGYAKIYSKDVSVSGISNTFLMYHFNDDVEDSSGNDNDGTASNISYATSMTNFGQAIEFTGAADSKVTFPEFNPGTGPFTIEFFVNWDVTPASQGRYMVTSHAGQSGYSQGYFGLRLKSYNYLGIYIATSSANANFYQQTIPSAGHMSTGSWYHVAITRDSAGLMYFFWSPASDTSSTLLGTSSTTANNVPLTIGGGYDWVLGQQRGTGTASRAMDGKIDHLLMTTDCKYTSSYTIPTSPYNAGATTTTHLFCSDSAGNEYQLTKAYEPA